MNNFLMEGDKDIVLKSSKFMNIVIITNTLKKLKASLKFRYGGFQPTSLVKWKETV